MTNLNMTMNDSGFILEEGKRVISYRFDETRVFEFNQDPSKEQVINNDLHSRLLQESISEYSDIWDELAKR